MESFETRHESLPYLSRLNSIDKIDSVGSGTLSGSYGMTYMSPPSCFSVDICPEVLLAGLTVGAAAGFFALYQQITKKGRRKRDSSLHTIVYDTLNLLLNNGKQFVLT